MEVFSAGLAGGVAGEVLHWWGLRHDVELPHYARRWFYWLVTLAMIVLGGGVAFLQLGAGGETFVAFEVGLLAPMLLKRMGSGVAPPPEGALGPTSTSFRRFLRG